MEVGAHVWLRSKSSRWGWVPAKITKKVDSFVGKVPVINLTLTNDPDFVLTDVLRASPSKVKSSRYNDYYDDYDDAFNSSGSGYSEEKEFEKIVTVDPEQLKTADHEDLKLRNLSRSYHLKDENINASLSPTHRLSLIANGDDNDGAEEEDVVGGVHDLIGLTHLHEPAILHALRLRYDSDIIYTSTGPILIAINPFKDMPLYSEVVMEQYRRQGEEAMNGGSGGNAHANQGTSTVTPFKRRTNDALIQKMNRGNVTGKRLPPHAYQTADDAYRAMMRGMENDLLMNGGRSNHRPGGKNKTGESMPTNQSILVSGESGAGKTVTTKIVLNYLAMLSRKASVQAHASSLDTSYRTSPDNNGLSSQTLSNSSSFEDDNIESHVLQSNPILESFGNARTIRNDNSSRFGKYIDIRFTPSGKLTGASIETYLLEKVRLIHPSKNERNYHVFYQFLSCATDKEREEFYLGDYSVEDFNLLSQTDTYDRRDGVSDESNHELMLEAMHEIGFSQETIDSLMRLVVAILFAGNMTFTTYADDSCTLDEEHAALATAALLGISFDDLASALTSRTINTVHETFEKQFSIEQADKAREALIKSIYGAAFDHIVKLVNDRVREKTNDHTTGRKHSNNKSASMGILDIFGFETFETNNFEQLCINYTNEALQQQFNKYVFKLEQVEYEKEGILWKYISFPDNQDVINLIDQKHTGILAILDEQCIVPQSTDEKFTRYLYSKCDKHTRFLATSKQRVEYKFSIEHYAGHVEYSTDNWLEKNKDQLPAKSAALLKNSSFELLVEIQQYIRSEERRGRGVVATKSVGFQFSTQLKTLRQRIDVTTPHYIRCLKPNDELIRDRFEPKNIVDQLRCGGVLEAVRVSRAGYPTRYPHDVFLARYYILGDRADSTSSSKEESLRSLVSKIALNIWEADEQTRIHLLEAEKAQLELQSPKYDWQNQNSNSAPVYFRGADIINGPQSLAVESSAQTPPEKRHLSKNKSKLRLSIHSMIERTEHSQNVIRPESKNEFMSLDFVQRCAIAGLQLGKTKVFLRREAFDRIEAMRSQKFYGSAALIQAMVRGKICRDHYVMMRYAAIKIQSIVRVIIALNSLQRRRDELEERSYAASIIQKFYRVMKIKQESNEIRVLYDRAAAVIQSRARGINARNNYYTAFFGFIRLQAIFRGVLARKNITHLHKIEADLKALEASKLANEKARLEAEAMEKARLEADAKEKARLAAEQEEKQKSRAVQILEPETKPMSTMPSTEVEVRTSDLYRYMQEEDWANVEKVLDQNPVLAEEVEPSSGELPLHVISRHTSAWSLLVDMILVLNPKALVHRDNMGALPIHHAAAHDNVSALEIIYSAYKGGINEVDKAGRLPLHVAAEFDAVDAVKFLLANSPEAAFTMIYRPIDGSGGGLPLHVACRNYASIGVITALLAENFASAKRTDENGDLPLHLLLRCGEPVDLVVVKTLITCFSSAASRTDMNGDLPLSIAIRNRCKPTVINSILMQYPNAAGSLNSEGQSPLHLAFEYGADDRTILGLLNHAPELSTLVDKKSGLLPIQVATQNEHSHFIVHNMLKRDMPIDLEEKVRAQLLPHHYSWNHVVSCTDDLYHQVVTKILQQCTQPQVLALAHVEGPDGKIALASATTVCKHEMRVMLRLFNTLEVVNQRPAYTNPISDTQIFYALRYEPPQVQSSAFTILHEEKTDKALGDYIENWDDTSVTSAVSRASIRSTLSSRSQQSIDDKLRQIRREKGQQVIAKLTSRSDVVERELRVRKDYRLSRHYVPAVISVHHTVQHAAYSEAMAEPGYCITMEGADTTAENLMLDMRKEGKPFPIKALKRIGISLLHMHEHQLVHCDYGTHNIGKFGSRWKLLGVGGSVPIGKATNPNRGFYHPPESIVVENKRSAIGKKAITAVVVSIPARSTYDIWAYGVVFYEAIAGMPLPPYACRGKRPMTSAEVAKIGQWDENSIKKALKYLPSDVDSNAKSLIKRLLHHDPSRRFTSMRQVLEHPFFATENKDSASDPTPKNETLLMESRSIDNQVPQAVPSQSMSDRSLPKRSTSSSVTSQRYNGKHFTQNLSFVDENSENNVAQSMMDREDLNQSFSSVTSDVRKRSKKFGGNFRSRFKNKNLVH